MQKRFQPATTAKTTYKLNFNNPIYNPHDGHMGSISSTPFTFNNIMNHYMEDDGSGNIRFYYLSTSNTKIYSDRKAGTVNYATGEIVINHQEISYAPNNEVKIIAKASDYDVFTVRNLIPLIADASVTVLNHATGATDARVDTVTTTVGQITQVAETGVNTVTY